MNRCELPKALASIVVDLLRTKGYVAMVDVFIKLNYLNLETHNSWRMRQIPYLEKGIKVNLGKITFIMKTVRRIALDRGLTESCTAYMSWGKGRKTKLQFSKSGVDFIERAYATHLIQSKPNKDSATMLTSTAVQLESER